MADNKIRQKSAAEFFMEHQQIAGFDNPGKSLFTSVRELVENSLDATECICVLPDITLKIIEYTEAEHNSMHGINKTPSTTLNKGGDENVNIDLSQESTISNTAATSSSSSTTTSGKKKGKDKETKDVARMYYKLVISDNGCGMKEHDIGNLLGKVLSGSKHGIKQTRGKFGLGAKMALIWSKKSSGLPIEISSAVYNGTNGNKITEMVLDMDIYKNEPKILSTRILDNNSGWHGTTIAVTVNGSWTYYKSRILQYFQQLAVITPYANFEVVFQSLNSPKKNFELNFTRRSEQMPSIAREILPHPSSLNHITLSEFIGIYTFY